MLRSVLAIAFIASAATVAAQSRPSTLNMTCNQAAGLVASAGSIVMTTGQHTYKRFVASPYWCQMPKYPWLESVRTLDNPRCTIGYVCTNERPFEFDRGFMHFR